MVWVDCPKCDQKATCKRYLIEKYLSEGLSFTCVKGCK